MISTLVRRLTRFEAAAEVMAELPVIFVRFVRLNGAEPPVETVRINGVVWHRAVGETQDTFLARVKSEARPMRPGCGTVGFLD